MSFRPIIKIFYFGFWSSGKFALKGISYPKLLKSSYTVLFGVPPPGYQTNCCVSWQTGVFGLYPPLLKLKTNILSVRWYKIVPLNNLFLFPLHMLSFTLSNPQKWLFDQFLHNLLNNQHCSILHKNSLSNLRNSAELLALSYIFINISSLACH